MNQESNDRTGWFQYKGRSILRLDYTNLDAPGFVERIKQNHKKVRKMVEEGANNLLLLSDVRGAVPSREALAELRSNVKRAATYTKANAIIGIDGMRRHMLNFINKASPLESRACASEEEAKEWLITQALKPDR
jgi:hypothetical protein